MTFLMGTWIAIEILVTFLVYMLSIAFFLLLFLFSSCQGGAQAQLDTTDVFLRMTRNFSPSFPVFLHEVSWPLCVCACSTGQRYLLLIAVRRCKTTREYSVP